MKVKTAITLVLISLMIASTVQAQADMPQVQMDTSAGTIVIELNPRLAPKSVENFLAYVREGFYDGTIFHRVIKGFMIQGGGMTAEMQPKNGHTPIANEADNALKNTIGTIAMARTADPHSATSQFFINVKDNDFLNHSSKSMRGWGYCVFGRVTKGMEVVQAIENVETTARAGHRDVPVTPVVIERVRILSEESGEAEKQP
jgi:peptidyl-prolyl cis-trans isomerase B (cyclophilin B)